MRYYAKQRALSRSHSQHPEGGPTIWSGHWGIGELTAVWEGRLSPLGAEDIESRECRSRSCHTQILPGKSNKSSFSDTARRLQELAAKPENLSSISRMVTHTSSPHIDHKQIKCIGVTHLHTHPS